MITRQQSAAAAAVILPLLPLPPPALPLPTPRQLQSSTFNLIQHFIRIGMKLPMNRICPHCQREDAHLKHRASDRYRDGCRLRCSKCKYNFSPRHGSFLQLFDQPLFVCGMLLRCFDAGITIAQASHVHELHRNTVSRMWKLIRERCRHFILQHPIIFPPDEIVEVDELYLPALQQEQDIFEEEPPKVWVIGMIGRDTGLVALEIAENHQTETIRPLIESHLPYEQTRTITDQDASYNFLKERHPHFNSIKRRAGGALWVESYLGIAIPYAPITIHSNTIEGYWSQFRRRLHDSHGWSAEYVPLVLYECMFRSMKLSLSTALQPI